MPIILVFTILFIIVLVIKNKSLGNTNLESIKSNVFTKFEDINIEDDLLRSYLNDYQHIIYFIYIGSLKSGNKYAVLIGSSEDWLNIITRTKSKDITYETYGFNIYDERWSYGSKVIGAQEFRDFTKNHRNEIIRLNKALKLVRKRRKLEIKAELKKQSKTEKIENKKFNNEKKTIAKMQNFLNENLIDKLSTINFEFNNNKSKHSAAQKEASDHYFNIDIESQTCSCEDFNNINSRYELNDLRRLCPHLFRIIKQRELLKKDQDTLNQFILENLRQGFTGLYKGQIIDDKQFAIIIYNDIKDIYVATPKSKSIGYVMYKWSIVDNKWIPSGGSKEINSQIDKKILELLPL